MGYHGNYNDIKREAAAAAPTPPNLSFPLQRAPNGGESAPPGGEFYPPPPPQNPGAATASQLRPRKGQREADPPFARIAERGLRDSFHLLDDGGRRENKTVPHWTSKEKVKKTVLRFLSFLFFFYKQGNGTAVPE